jgi:hypothetical protein
MSGSSRQGRLSSSHVHDVVDFVPETQTIAGVLSALIGIVLLVVGSVLLAFPWWIIPLVFPHINTPSSLSSSGAVSFLLSLSSSSSPPLSLLDLTLSRLTGGILLGQGLSSLFLLVNLYHDANHPSSMKIRLVSVDKSRTAISLQALTGLLIVIVGLLDNRITDDTAEESVHSLYLLAMGFGVLILACLGLMFSYWPVLPDEEEQDPQQRPTNRHLPNHQPTENDATEPLLGHLDDDDAEEASANQPLEELVGDEEQVQVVGDENTDYSNEGGTSRIRGTRRLLKLAAPQVLYLYLGCAVLLVRLPFSLSIPHFVSTTLGAVARGDFEGARAEILLLFIMGTIDAFLDFWCVFLFGYGTCHCIIFLSRVGGGGARFTVNQTKKRQCG